MQMGETSCAVSLRLKPPLAANYCPPIQKYILHIAACIKPDPPHGSDGLFCAPKEPVLPARQEILDCQEAERERERELEAMSRVALILDPGRAPKLCTCRDYNATWLGTSPRQTLNIRAAVAQAFRCGEQTRHSLDPRWCAVSLCFAVCLPGRN